jgi:hypothetical protein
MILHPNTTRNLLEYKNIPQEQARPRVKRSENDKRNN